MAVGAGVHCDCATNRARNSGQTLQPCQAGHLRPSEQAGQPLPSTTLDNELVFNLFDTLRARGRIHPDQGHVEIAIGRKDIAPFSKNERPERFPGEEVPQLIEIPLVAHHCFHLGSAAQSKSRAH